MKWRIVQQLLRICRTFSLCWYYACLVFYEEKRNAESSSEYKTNGNIVQSHLIQL